MFSKFSTLLMVFVAGGVGATLRVMLAELIDQTSMTKIPQAGVWAANMLGCLAIGFCSVWLSSPAHKVVVMGGLLGGFTTYSAFALFSSLALAEGRYALLATQLAIHLIGGISMALVGAWIAKTFLPS